MIAVSLYITILTGKNSVWLNSVQEFTEIEACLLVTFFICLQNQLKSDSHVPEIFVKLKFSPGLFEKMKINEF